MTTASAGLAFLVALIVALAAVHVPLGDYMYRVYTTDKDNAAERLVYRLIGADPKSEQTWAAYARSVLAFSAVSVLSCSSCNWCRGGCHCTQRSGYDDDAGPGVEYRDRLCDQYQLAGLFW